MANGHRRGEGNLVAGRMTASRAVSKLITPGLIPRLDRPVIRVRNTQHGGLYPWATRLCLVVAVVITILATSFSASAAVGTSSLPVFLPPYHGITYSHVKSVYTSGCWKSKATDLAGPTFNRSTGMIHAGASASTGACAASGNTNFSAVAQEELDFQGPSWNATTTGWVSATVNVSIRWTVNLTNARASLSSGPATGAQLFVYAAVYDSTNQSYFPSTLSFSNSSNLFLRNGTYLAHLHQNYSFIIPLKLVNGHSFSFEFGFYLDASTWEGPGTSTGYAWISLEGPRNGLEFLSFEV